MTASSDGATNDAATNGSIPHRNRTSSVSRRPGYAYDPRGAVRVAWLRQARTWMDTGSTYQALAAYAEMLSRYGGTPTAGAAADDLLEMVTLLQ